MLAIAQAQKHDQSSKRFIRWPCKTDAHENVICALALAITSRRE
jgi:hypothetical protein